ncbi:MAG: undecaprenyl-diphosphate phosphatase [Magnetovibrio sp.]|nr:undecaprenyl-diphosphate phosphatase [Magnetovibrio sp.]
MQGGLCAALAGGVKFLTDGFGRHLNIESIRTLPFFHIAILALVQGITEFLPISSSAHLVLVPWLVGWADQGVTLDVAVHVGTLGAVVLYLWRDIVRILDGLWRMVKGKGINDGARLGLFLVLGTLPVIGVGYWMHKTMPDGIRSIEVIGWATLIFGLVLWLTDYFGVTVRRIDHLKISDILIIGVSQCIALIPGTSRSGITMAAARLLGMERPDCARFSMLLSIPAILGAGFLKGLDLYKSGDTMQINTALIGIGLSFVSALIAIALMMAWLKRASFTPFVIYRIVLGVALLAVAYDYVGLPA